MNDNVVDLIKHDHRELERLFDVAKNQPDQRATIVPMMITLLTAHSRAEEAEVYTAAGEAGITDDMQHSQKEHLEADQLAAALAETALDSPDFEERLTDLVEAVTHHIGEEEETVLPGLAENLTADRLGELGQAFATSRTQHLGERPADITKDDLEQQAANLDLSGASGKSKAELSSELESAAEE